MLVKRHPTPRSFLDQAEPFLLIQGAENRVLLETARGWDVAGALPAGVRLLTVLDDEATIAGETSVVAAAIVDDGRMTLSAAASEEAIEALNTALAV